MTCEGCKKEIYEGEHFLKVVVELDTRVPPSFVQHGDMEPTVLTTYVHNPECLHRWAINDPIIGDVFYRG